MDTEENCNLICPPGYPPAVAERMREIPEKEVPFTLIGSLLECAPNYSVSALLIHSIKNISARNYS